MLKRGPVLRGRLRTAPLLNAHHFVPRGWWQVLKGGGDDKKFPRSAKRKPGYERAIAATVTVGRICLCARWKFYKPFGLHGTLRVPPGTRSNPAEKSLPAPVSARNIRLRAFAGPEPTKPNPGLWLTPTRRIDRGAARLFLLLGG